jgi:hypothetical protein
MKLLPPVIPVHELLSVTLCMASRTRTPLFQFTGLLEDEIRITQYSVNLQQTLILLINTTDCWVLYIACGKVSDLSIYLL